MNTSKTLGKQYRPWFWPAGYAYVAVLVDVAGALAAQLQGDGCQVFGGSLHDHFAHRAVAGVENVIKSLSQKLLSLWNSSRHYRIKLLKQKKVHTVRLDEIFQYLLTVLTFWSISCRFATRSYFIDISWQQLLHDLRSVITDFWGLHHSCVTWTGEREHVHLHRKSLLHKKQSLILYQGNNTWVLIFFEYCLTVFV